MSKDVEQKVRTLVRAMDEAQVPVTWREAQSRAPHTTVHEMPRPRRTLIFGVALAAAATLAGLALVTSRSDETKPANTGDPTGATSTVPSSTAATPRLTTAPAVTGADSGTLATPLGALAWRHVEGSVGEVPAINGGIVVADDGLVAIENPIPVENERFEVSAGVAQLWRGTASGEWATDTAPFGDAPGFAFVQQVGGELWLSLSQSFQYRSSGGETRTRDDPVVRERLWRSVDGLGWTEVAQPEGASSPVTLEDIGGALWLSDSAGAVWVDQDGAWVERLSGPLPTPPSTGLEWESDFGSPATVGDVTIRTVTSWGKGPDLVALLGLDGLEGYGWSNNTEPGLVHLVLDRDPSNLVSQGPPDATLSVLADGNTVHFVDETGREVFTFSIDDPGFDAAAYVEVVGLMGNRSGTELRATSPVWNSLQVQGPDGVTTSVIPPWGGLRPAQDEFYGLTADLMVADGKFVAFVSRYRDVEPNRFETWTSADGINWVGPVPFQVDDATEVLSVSVSVVGDRIGALLWLSRGRIELWYSDDGQQWRPGEPQGQAEGQFEPWAGGGVLFDHRVLNSQPGSLWFSTDLASWERIDLRELGISIDTAVSSNYVADDEVLVFEEDVEGSRSFWVLTADGAVG